MVCAKDNPIYPNCLHALKFHPLRCNIPRVKYLFVLFPPGFGKMFLRSAAAYIINARGMANIYI